jgi:hypothetical protein
MNETLVSVSVSALRPINLVGFEDFTSVESTLVAQRQSAEVTTNHITFLRKAGAVAMKAAGVIHDTATTLTNQVERATVYAQIKTWDAVEATNKVVADAKDYLKLQGGKALSHAVLAGLALGGSAALCHLKELVQPMQLLLMQPTR